MLCREAETVRTKDKRLFYTPSTYYRPHALKELRILVGSGQDTQVFDNFDLRNLNSVHRDPSHVAYARYLEDRNFLPAHSDQAYWSHFEKNNIPVAAADPAARAAAQSVESRGFFNIFPVDLSIPLLDKLQPGKNLGNLRAALSI